MTARYPADPHDPYSEPQSGDLRRGDAAIGAGFEIIALRIAAVEREECAKIADAMADEFPVAAPILAKAIRERNDR